MEIAHVGQFHNEIMSVRFSSSFFNHLLGGLVTTVANIISNSVVEKHRFLTDDANLRPEPANIQLSDINTIDLHLQHNQKH